MTRDELFNMAQSISRDVIERNKGLINEYIHDAFKSTENAGKMTTGEAIASATVLCLNLAPELSAAITANMLIDLGLVSLEDDD